MTTRVGKCGMRHALFRWSTGTNQPILRLKVYTYARRHVVCDQRRDSDAEIYEHARFQLVSNSTCNDLLRFHSDTHELATR